ncbi:MAG: CaiB/BaiF CoA transferase family protein [Dehalococcoidia bacterium]
MNEGEAAWLPLRGVRVLDFTWMIAGPLGTRLLANFGAEVIKIESYNRVDRVRETGPHPDGTWSVNEDGSFNDVNLGKQSILLNLGYPEGQAIARRLAAVSDVTAANFTGDRLDRWSLGYDDLVRVQPNLIVLNMPVFESTGPRRRWGAIGSHINALAGINAISGFAPDPPFGLGPLYPDFSGNPFHLTAAILSALIDRDRGAGAQWIEVSQYESTAGVLGPALLQQAVTGVGPRRAGNRSDRACPHNVYPCAGTTWPAPSANSEARAPGSGPLPSPTADEDRWCAIEVAAEAEWAALCGVLGHEEWRSDPRFATDAARRANEDALDALIAEETRRRQVEDLAAGLQAAGVAAAPVNRLDHLLADPWYRTEYFSELPGPEGCIFTVHGEPIRPFDRKQPVSRAPLLGEHTENVLESLLGLTRAEIDQLYAAGVLG